MSTQKVGLVGVFVFVLSSFQGGLSAAAERAMSEDEQLEAAIAESIVLQEERLEEERKLERKRAELESKHSAAAGSAEEKSGAAGQQDDTVDKRFTRVNNLIANLFGLPFMKEAQWNRSFRSLLESVRKGDRAKEAVFVNMLNILSTGSTVQERNAQLYKLFKDDIGASLSFLGAFTWADYDSGQSKWKEIVRQFIARKALGRTVEQIQYEKDMEQVELLVQADRRNISEDLAVAAKNYPQNVKQLEIDLQTKRNRMIVLLEVRVMPLLLI
ncbi:MAG: hypothetical protein NT124_01790 [Candidatus Dependentiae bacterium]|nr:hypothetical protein [Candidatus Dependentiae bacterium]